jgi:hypothetical protein
MAHRRKDKERGGRAHEHARRNERQSAAGTTRAASGRRPVIIGIVLGAIAIGGAALWGGLRDGGTGRDTAASMSAPATVPPTAASLPPASPGTRVPLNDVDPVTGKPITASSPTLTHKGYVIGFCCANSEGYKGGWNRMSEAQKDAFVRRYVK